MKTYLHPFALMIFVLTACTSSSAPKNPMATPKTTAVSFYNAAMAGDMNLVRSLCEPGAAQQAESIASKIKAANLPKPSWRKLSLDPPKEGLQVNWGMKFLTIEMDNINGNWKIVTIGFSE